MQTATDKDIIAFQKWLKDSDIVDRDHEEEFSTSCLYQDASPNVVPIESGNKNNCFTSPNNYSAKSRTSDQHFISPKDYLKVDQLCTYKIIVWHLEETLADRNPPPLHLIINGEGGTGKSKVIEAVTDYFASRGASHLLVKMAYTRIAASHIQGITCHAATMISHNNKPMSVKTKEKLQQFWAPILYEIINKFSMLGKTFFAKLLHNISIGKSGSTNVPIERSFGGTSVIMTGDKHQFPPVTCSIHEVLYYPPDPERDSALSLIGPSLYEEFCMLITLKEQV